MAKITTIKKAAKKKKMSKQDEKQIKDHEEREKAEKGYDEDARRYGMFEQSVYDAKPKQKTDVDVSGRTDGKKINYVYSMRDRRLGDSTPAHREFARIRIGDTELAKKEKEVADRLKQKLKEEESKITSKIVKGVVHINGKPLNHSSVEVDGVNKKDYPDFADVYTSRAEFKDGSELSHEELEHLDMNHPEVAHEAAHESIRGGSSKLQVSEDKKPTGTPKQRSGTCWSGYTQYGMKMKKGRSVPNCVKDK
jgi:hypothetical protein